MFLLSRLPISTTCRTAAVTAAAVLSSIAVLLWSDIGLTASALPPPSRTTYKCEVEGKVTYSDDPCVGAEKIEIEPTRGVNKLSGRQRTGRDVSREHLREGLADAVKPLTGKNAKELDTFGRRLKLSEQARKECAALDVAIRTSEDDERRAAKEALRPVQERLYLQRDRYRKLGC